MVKREFDRVQGSGPMGLGDEDVAIIREVGGHATMVPRSIRNKPQEVRELATELVRAVAAYDRLSDDIRAMVLEGRERGLSWEALGWCLGTSGSAVQKRFGALL